jgi:hypothetical protein
MIDHKATPEQWSAVEGVAKIGSADCAAILELRYRVEMLEKRCEVLQDRHHRLTLKVGHLEHDLYRDDDEPQQHCLEAMDPPEANSQPELQGPTDEELDELWAEIDGGGAIWAWQYFARAVLARWGTPAIKPVPVAERPWEREGWCDKYGMCWRFDPCDRGWWSYGPILPSDGNPAPFTYLLPHHALAVPTTH